MFSPSIRTTPALSRILLALLLACALPAMASRAFAQAPAATTGKAISAPVDINSANESVLQTLPGVGPAVAKKIIAERPFSSVDDLAKVKGIGPVKLAALRNLVTVGGAGAASRAAASVTPPVATKASAPVPMPARPTMPALPAMPAPPSMPAPSVVPTVASAKAALPGAVTHSPGKKALPLGRININTASESDLETLPGIGPVKAKAIVAGRPYAKVEDVMKVPGIKEGIFGKIKDVITVQ
jgi:competence protein ComEA